MMKVKLQAYALIKIVKRIEYAVTGVQLNFTRITLINPLRQIKFVKLSKLKVCKMVIHYLAITKMCKIYFKSKNILSLKSKFETKWRCLIRRIYRVLFAKELEISMKFLKTKSQAWRIKNGIHQLKILKDFEVKNCQIIAKECIVNQTFGKDYKESIQLLNEVIEQKDIKINFENFTEQQLLIGHTDFVYGIDICRHRNLLASASDDGTVKLWNLENNTLIKTYEFSIYMLDVVFSKQGNLLAIGGYSSIVKLIDISDLKKDNPILELKGHRFCVNRITFSNDSKYLILASSDKSLIIWEILQMKQQFQLYSGGFVNGVGISDDDTLLASNSDDGNIRIWNFKNQNLLCTQKAHDKGSGIQFSKDQKMLVSCGFDGKIKLWSLTKLNNQSKLLLIRKFKTATKCIWTALFSTCSKYIISMSNQDREIKVIDSETCAVVKLFKFKATNRFPKNQVAISEDMGIIAYGKDKKVVVWRQK